MKVVITGGCGFLGRLVAEAVLKPNALDQQVTELVLLDAFAGPTLPPSLAEDPRTTVCLGDITDPSLVNSVITPDVGVIFHMASIMSGQGESDPDLCMRVNIDGGRNVLQAARATGSCPRVIFSSTHAIYGNVSEVSDATRATPQSTYGATKVIVETLLGDYTRKGFISGRGVRLPTICVRPGAPNGASTGWYSGIVREPLFGVDVVVPLPADMPHAITGFRHAVDCLMFACNLPDDRLAGHDRVFNLPALSSTLGELHASLVRVASDVSSLGSVEYAPDDALTALVGSFPQSSSGTRALEFGFPPAPTLDDLVRQFIDAFGPSVVPPAPTAPPTPKPVVGFVGCGFMGEGMIGCLARKGFDVRIYNRTAAKADALIEQLSEFEVTRVDTLNDLAACSSVHICLASEAAGIAVLFEQGLLAACAARGCVVVDHGTVSPSLSARCHSGANEAGGSFIDAPISGGPEGARNGTLAIMCGGDEAAFAKVKPALDAMGANVLLMGGAGAGTGTKLVNQLLVGVHGVAVGEGLQLAQKLNVTDLGQVVRLVCQSYGQSKILERNGAIIAEAEASGVGLDALAGSGCPLRLLRKDLDIITTACRETNAYSPLTDLSAAMYRSSAECGFEEFDIAIPFYRLQTQDQEQQ